MTRRLPAAALIVLALAACGGHTEKPPQPTAAETHWRTGLVKWAAGMTHAINRISVLFSSPASVRAIEGGDRKTVAKLGRFEDTLSGCAETLQAVGKAPAIYATAHREALRACAALKHGAALMRAGVRQIQNGLGVELLTRSSDALAVGQDGIRRALLNTKQG